MASDRFRASKITSLSEADGEVLDALLAARAVGSDQGPMTAGSAPRAAKIRTLLSLLDQDKTPAAPDDLIERTVSRAEAVLQQQRFAQQVQMLTEPQRTLGVGWRQIAAAVCVFFVGLSLFFPVLERQRAETNRLACASNLGVAGQAFSSYADQYDGFLPRGQAGGAWWDMGERDPNDGTFLSNSAHLYLLVRGEFIHPDKLACPANRYAPVRQMTTDDHDWPTLPAVSYSYHTPRPTIQVRIDRDHHLAILADKNPLIVNRNGGRPAFDSKASPFTPSKQHRFPGQNILTLDGSVRWTIRPVIIRPGSGTDIIWTPSGNVPATGSEAPTGPEDSFLTH